MPRYHINLANSIGVHRDAEGREFESDDAAIREAARTLSGILPDDISLGHTTVTAAVTIERDDGARVAELVMRTDVRR